MLVLVEDISGLGARGMRAPSYPESSVNFDSSATEIHY